MTNTEILDRLKKAIDSLATERDSVNVYNKLTDLQKIELVNQISWGVIKSGLYILPEREYHELCNYAKDKGFNI